MKLYETSYHVQITRTSLRAYYNEQNNIHHVPWALSFDPPMQKIYSTFVLQRLLNIYSFCPFNFNFPQQKICYKNYIRLSVKVTNKTKTKTCTYQVA